LSGFEDELAGEPSPSVCLIVRSSQRLPARRCVGHNML
jgi:hypothetical protein